MRALAASRPHFPPDWRPDARRRRDQTFAIYEELCGVRHVLPHLAGAHETHVGLVLPRFDGGGLEKIMLNYARVIRGRGLFPHLFVMESSALPSEPEGWDAFESVNFAPPPGDSSADAVDDLVGLLATMQVVVNAGTPAAHAAMAKLRGLGVGAYCALPRLEFGASDPPPGDAHAALGYEYAYDGFVVASAETKAWCVGQAIPEDKVFVVPHAPSYATTAGAIEASLAAKRERSGAPLRALYIGELDDFRELDRLPSVVRRTRVSGVQWRCVAASTAEGAPPALEQLGLRFEPPVAGAAALDALYAWADVVTVDPRFEGAPLTLLEAERAGCVALDVDAASPELCETLESLAGDRSRALEIGAQAARRVADLTWEASLSGWLDALTSSLASDVSP